MPTPEPRLGPHAADVLALLLSGASRATIARALHLSRHTVGHYVEAHIHAHGVRTAHQLACLVWSGRCAALEATIRRLERDERRRGERRAPAD